MIKSHAGRMLLRGSGAIRVYGLITAMYCATPGAHAQLYTLESCTTLAMENNPELKLEQLQMESSKVSLKQDWEAVMPGINAGYNLGYTDGRSIDPYTNDYINQSLTFSNAAVELNAVIFNGFRLQHLIRQGRSELKASELEVEEAKRQLRMRVTLAYLQVLNARDRIALAESRMAVTQGQVDRLKTLYSEEVGNPADYTDIQGQLANDKIAIANARNDYRTAVINLFTILGIQQPEQPQFADIGPARENFYNHSAEQVYEDALNGLAVFKARDYRLEAANRGVQAARAAYLPEISIFGQLNTNYSSAARMFNPAGSIVEQTGDYLILDGQQYNILTNQTLFEPQEISYADQFNNNFNSVVGLSVNLPLFNGFRTRNQVSQQKIDRSEREIDRYNTRLQFRQAIDQAYANMETAYLRWRDLQAQTELYEESFRINEIRFNNGLSNIVEYITSKNNLDISRLNQANAAYEYELRVRVLEFFRGNL